MDNYVTCDGTCGDLVLYYRQNKKTYSPTDSTKWPPKPVLQDLIFTCAAGSCSKECLCFVVLREFDKDTQPTGRIEWRNSTDASPTVSEDTRRITYRNQKEVGIGNGNYWELSCECLKIDKNKTPVTQKVPPPS